MNTRRRGCAHPNNRTERDLAGGLFCAKSKHSLTRPHNRRCVNIQWLLFRIYVGQDDNRARKFTAHTHTHIRDRYTWCQFSEEVEKGTNFPAKTYTYPYNIKIGI